MQELPRGLMLSVPLAEEELVPLLRDRNLSLAAVEWSNATVIISGTS